MVLAFASSDRYNTGPIVDVSTRVVSQRAWIEVNLGNLVENARAVQAAAGGVPLLPMVKADAYGLGAVQCARALEALDPWGYGVATIPEGAALRRTGIARPIVVFTPAGESLLEEYHRHEFRAVLDDPGTVAVWDRPFHLEIDTGMSRCGVRWTERERIARCASPHLEGVFTHLHSADTSPGSVADQMARFGEAIAALPERPPLVHVANSAGAWRLEDPFDLARPGIFLYGGRAGPDLPRPRAVAAVRATVVSVRTVSAGDSVSYGADWRAPVGTRIATLGIGYADGVPRSVVGSGCALIAGERRPIVGRVTMDFIMIDVGTDERIDVGDVATLIGATGADEITLDEFAGWADTISYEILVRLGPRLERRYRGP